MTYLRVSVYQSFEHPLEYSVDATIDHDLSTWLRLIARTHFTGELVIKTFGKESWTFYFLLGRLIWANGGLHRFRRWHRMLSIHCPTIDPYSIRARQGSLSEFWEYLVLTGLIKRNKIQREQAIALVQNTLAEVLFDALQHGESVHQSEHSTERIKRLGEPLVLVNGLQTLKSAQECWKNWCEAGLENYSPNYAPKFRDPTTAEQQLPHKAYQMLANLSTGNTTLREIVMLLKVDLLQFCRALVPFVHKGVLDFQSVDDWIPAYIQSSQPQHPNIEPTVPQPPLVMCIDDSPSICHMLEKILTQSGYRFIGIQDPVQALPLLLETKPDLIFLDLVMPVASGYEICTQIRRTSLFKETPVIIITGKDGIVDRVRAKVAGASGFIAKPLEGVKVVDVVQRYLGTVSHSSSSNPKHSSYDFSGGAIAPTS